MSDRELEALFTRAHEAGMKAGTDVVPTPMHVVERANPLDDTSPVVHRYAPVMDGVCGFAWIVIRPGTSRAARMAKELFQGYNGHGGGIHIHVHQFNQSLTRKEAYAEAFAQVLKAAGISAHAASRMD